MKTYPVKNFLFSFPEKNKKIKKKHSPSLDFNSFEERKDYFKEYFLPIFLFILFRLWHTEILPVFRIYIETAAMSDILFYFFLVIFNSYFTQED